MGRDEEEGPAPDGPAEDTAELTAVDEEWPLPPEYRRAAASPPPPAAAATTAAPPDPGTTHVLTAPAAAPAPARRPAPPLVAGALGVALLLLVGGLVLAFALRGDPAASEDGSAGSPAPPAATTGETTDPGTTETVTDAARVEVPDVSGLTVEVARQRLAARGLDARVQEAESEEPEGEVVRQDPEPQREVDPDATVLLVVSAGPADVEVPGVVGLSRSRAEAELREVGLVAGVRTEESGQRPGRVLEQSPSAGEQVEPGARVRLVVSVRPEPEPVRVPRVVGLPVADARARVREAGLRSTVTRVESSRDPGTVVRQTPRAGASAQQGAIVALEVSSGPALASVPDVVGLDETSARRELEGAGFRVRLVEEPTSEPSEDGIVVAQAPAGGTRAKPGTTVTITVRVFS